MNIVKKVSVYISIVFILFVLPNYWDLWLYVQLWGTITNHFVIEISVFVKDYDKILSFSFHTKLTPIQRIYTNSKDLR